MRRPTDGAKCAVGRLLGRRVFGDSLGTFGDGVLGQFTGQQQTNGGLDLSARDGGATVVVSQTGSFGGDAFEDVVDKAVHDGHGLARDTGVGVDLFQHFVDVDAVRLPPPALLLLVTSTGGFRLGNGLLGTFRAHLGRHFVRCVTGKDPSENGVPSERACFYTRPL